MKMKKLSLICQALIGTGLAVAATDEVYAHGSMEVPISRVYNCYKENPENPTSAACAAAVAVGGTQPFYDWNGVRQGGANGQHRQVVPDGQLCGGGGSEFVGLNLARSDWEATTIAPNANGQYQFVYHATAPHATKYFDFYVTKDGYDPTQPLTWNDLEAAPFCSITSVTLKNGRYNMTCPLPQGKSGKHVIYAIWQRSDSPEAFYACTDVVFSSGGTSTPTPTPVPGATAAPTPAPTPGSTAAPSPTPAPTAAPSAAAPDGTWVGGYYPSWSYWRVHSGFMANANNRSLSGLVSSQDTFKIVSPSAAKPKYVTYAFLAIKTSKNTNADVGYGGSPINYQGAANGTVVDTDELLEADVAAKNYAYLQDYAAQTGAIPMASVGGWSYTQRFTDFYQDWTANPQVLDTFVNSAAAWMKNHGFKGLSIDWEYPGFGHNGSQDQGKHQGEGAFFNTLISRLSAKLAALSQQDGVHYYLSVATSVNPSIAPGDNGSIDWKTVAQQVDWIDLMALDINGEFNAGSPSNQAVAGSQAPLDYIQKALDFYIAQAGVPSRKIVLGVPAYARQMLVQDQPASANQFGYGGYMKYPGVDGVFNTFQSNYYAAGAPYSQAFTDSPNPEAYYPAGGAVDFTGVYPYSCFTKLLNPSATVAADCPMMLNATPNGVDNRGQGGQVLPSDIKATQVGVYDWLYSQSQSVVQNFYGGSGYYPAYPVFSLESKRSLDIKIDQLVRPYNLGGVWFWDYTQDSVNDPSMSLVVEAYNKLRSPAASPTPAPSVTPGPTASPSPAATATPKPTATPSPVPTATPKPTAIPTPVPTVTPRPTANPSPVPTATPKPTASPAPTPAPTYSKYVDGAKYAKGAKVVAIDGNVYQCKVASWCSVGGRSYAPFTGLAWRMAWTQVSTGGSPDVSAAQPYRNGIAYKAGDIVISADQAYYYCKVPGWCGKESYAPGSSYGALAWGKF